ncbi:hypothetical protein Pmani_011676 [Petrolisthes manimaculis]|uniref:Uncharacterized protein n=1 Tax=Petrolisthes manimaculis TaxID=1843537 RepID=A0AAE1Q2H7_9EUCA|nr:hypothetical protein Pmani_011676 [Petrolisthes manimaculis]
MLISHYTSYCYKHGHAFATPVNISRFLSSVGVYEFKKAFAMAEATANNMEGNRGIIDQLATNMTDNDAFEAQFHYNQMLIRNTREAHTEDRQAITLRFLTTGEAYKSLNHNYRVAHKTLSLVICETCEVIIDEVEGSQPRMLEFSRRTIPHYVHDVDEAHKHYRKDPLHGLQPRQQHTRQGHVKAVRDYLTNSYNRPDQQGT